MQKFFQRRTLLVGLVLALPLFVYILMARGTRIEGLIVDVATGRPIEEVFLKVELFGTSCFDIAHCGKHTRFARLDLERVPNGHFLLAHSLQSLAVIDRRVSLGVYKEGYVLTSFYNGNLSFRYDKEFESHSEWKKALLIKTEYSSSLIHPVAIGLQPTTAKGRNRVFELLEMQWQLPGPHEEGEVWRAICRELIKVRGELPITGRDALHVEGCVRLIGK